MELPVQCLWQWGLIHGNKCDESVSSVVQLSMATVV